MYSLIEAHIYSWAVLLKLRKTDEAAMVTRTYIKVSLIQIPLIHTSLLPDNALSQILVDRVGLTTIKYKKCVNQRFTANILYLTYSGQNKHSNFVQLLLQYSCFYYAVNR